MYAYCIYCVHIHTHIVLYRFIQQPTVAYHCSICPRTLKLQGCLFHVCGQPSEGFHCLFWTKVQRSDSTPSPVFGEACATFFQDLSSSKEWHLSPRSQVHDRARKKCEALCKAKGPLTFCNNNSTTGFRMCPAVIYDDGWLSYESPRKDYAAQPCSWLSVLGLFKRAILGGFRQGSI